MIRRKQEMLKGQLLYSEGNVQMVLEERNNKIRGKFRHLARQVSGEVFDVPEDNKIIFIYDRHFHVGQLSFSLPQLSLKEPGTSFDSEYYPQISFMFVHQDFQSCGFGKLMLRQAVNMIKAHCATRPVRLQSALDAVPFFEICGFEIVNEPVHCFHSGSKLFKTLVNTGLSLIFFRDGPF